MKRNKQDFSKISVEERKHMIEQLYILYPRNHNILAQFAYCHQHGKIAVEPNGMLLEGPAGMGKTTLWKYYMRDYPKKMTKDGKIVPVLAAKVDVPASPKSLVTALLQALGDAFPDKGSTVSQTLRLKKMMADSATELIFLDEFQHFIDRDSKKVLKTISDWLKNLMEDTGVPIILIGMPYSHSILDVGGNEQLQRRFSTRTALDPFDWINLEHRKDFRKFLQVLDEKVPLSEWSNLSDTSLAFRFYLASDGIVSNVMKLVRRATVIALELSIERLDLEVLSLAYEKCLAANAPGKQNPFTEDTEKPKIQPAKEIKQHVRATNARSKARKRELRASDVLS